MRLRLWMCVGILWGCGSGLSAADRDVAAALNRPILAPHRTLGEILRYAEPRIPTVPEIRDAAEWQRYAEGLRKKILDRIIYRGAAAGWRDAQTRVDWLETIPGGPGYRIRKLRYEILPGLWIPALLYQPERLPGRVPAALHV